MTLQIEHLSIALAPGKTPLVQNLSFQIAAGEGVALLGESGSGKSLTLLALLRLVPSLQVTGKVLFEGQDLLQLDLPTLRRVRGTRIGVVFQNAMTALTPTLTLESQLMEGLLYHQLATRTEAKKKVIEMLHLVELQDPLRLLTLYPHQLSGGMRQRILIAQALLTEPSLLIADEPTTALDALVQSQILSLLDSLRRKLNMSLLFITHDLQAAARVAQRNLILHQGTLLSSNTPLVTHHLYSERSKTVNLASVKASEEILLTTKGLTKQFAKFTAVHPVHLTLKKQRTLALIGESGSGKSTLGKMLLQLENPSSGEVWFLGRKQTYPLKDRTLRQKMQMIFQDPYSSLNPSMTLQTLLEEPLHIHRQHDRQEKVETMMHQVGLPLSFLSRRPHELSGGQRQRVGIGRALILHPEFVVCDEPLSSLDRPIQIQIMNLLFQLQEELGLTYLFITHNLEIAQQVAQEIAVMYRGHLLEIATAERLFKDPLHPYTQALLNVEQAHTGERSVPTSQGCPFRRQCPHALPKCAHQMPPLIQVNAEQQVACHLYQSSEIITQTRSI